MSLLRHQEVLYRPTRRAGVQTPRILGRAAPQRDALSPQRVDATTPGARCAHSRPAPPPAGRPGACARGTPAGPCGAAPAAGRRATACLAVTTRHVAGRPPARPRRCARGRNGVGAARRRARRRRVDLVPDGRPAPGRGTRRLGAGVAAPGRRAAGPRRRHARAVAARGHGHGVRLRAGEGSRRPRRTSALGGATPARTFGLLTPAQSARRVRTTSGRPGPPVRAACRGTGPASDQCCRWACRARRRAPRSSAACPP